MDAKIKSNKLNKVEISILIPVHNEEKLLEKNILELYNYLKKNKKFEGSEILICDNASTDRSREITLSLNKKFNSIKLIPAEKKGIGAGLKEGIKAAENNLLVFISIDLAFRLDFIENSIAKLLENDNNSIVIGSKGHPDSLVKRPLSRKILSKAYNGLTDLLFNLNIKDTQGTLTFKKSDIMDFFNKLESDDAFFQTEVLIWAKRKGKSIIEIPVVVDDFRQSSFNIKKESFVMLSKLIKNALK